MGDISPDSRDPKPPAIIEGLGTGAPAANYIAPPIIPRSPLETTFTKAVLSLFKMADPIDSAL
jgi:hypothetical protein